MADNPHLRIYVNKIENRLTLTIKTEYYLELLIPEAIKLIGSTKSKIDRDKNGENVPHLKITEVVLVHCNIVSKDYRKYSRFLHTFVPDKSFGQLLDISLKNLYFKKPLIQSFYVLKYGLLIKILNHYR